LYTVFKHGEEKMATFDPFAEIILKNGHPRSDYIKNSIIKTGSRLDFGLDFLLH